MTGPHLIENIESLTEYINVLIIILGRIRNTTRTDSNMFKHIENTSAKYTRKYVYTICMYKV